MSQTPQFALYDHEREELLRQVTTARPNIAQSCMAVLCCDEPGASDHSVGRRLGIPPQRVRYCCMRVTQHGVRGLTEPLAQRLPPRPRGQLRALRVADPNVATVLRQFVEWSLADAVKKLKEPTLKRLSAQGDAMRQVLEVLRNGDRSVISNVTNRRSGVPAVAPLTLAENKELLDLVTDHPVWDVGSNALAVMMDDARVSVRTAAAALAKGPAFVEHAQIVYNQWGADGFLFLAQKGGIAPHPWERKNTPVSAQDSDRKDENTALALRTWYQRLSQNLPQMR